MKVAYAALVFSSVVLVVLLSGMTPSAASATSYSITKIQSGLIASDPLTTGNNTNMKTGGTASMHVLYEDSEGLHIGVQSPSSGQWVNYDAHPPQANALLYHVLLTIPENSINDGVFNPGLYVEGSDFIPHVACESYADNTGYYWDVEYSPDAGKTYTILYISNPSSLPHTQDCTIITNGSNYLKVYLGGNLVYTNSSMNLGMSVPFVTFVQDDTSSSSAMHNATFANYYATSDENIKVTENPSNAAAVRILDSSGHVLASSPVTSGTAILNVGMYDFPLAATINVYDPNNTVIASSSASIYGGDVFSVTNSSGSSTVPQPPTGLGSIAVSSSQINLSWVAPSNNGGSSIVGYKIERSSDGGNTWSTIVSDTESANTAYNDTGLNPSTVYTYRVSAINAVGTSMPSNSASATTQSTSTGGTGSIILTGTQSTYGTLSTSPYQLTITNVNAGSGSNNLLVVGVAANNAGVGSITFAGFQLTKAVSSFNNNDAEFWYLANATGTGNVIVTMKGATSAIVGVYTLAGVDQENPVSSSMANHNSSPSSPTISLTTTNPNDWVLDLPSIYGGKTLSSPSCSQQWDINVPSAITGASSSTVVGSPGSVTCSWTASGGGDFWDDVAVEVKALGSGSSSTSTVSGTPTGLSAIAVSSSQINLSWVEPSNNGGSAITGYKIERSANAGSTWSTIVSNTGSTSTTYSDIGLVASTTYGYRVSAINSIGTSSPSNMTTATTQGASTVPGAPTGLLAMAVSSSQVNLSWTAPSNNGGSQIDGYVIERSDNGGSSWSTIQSDTGSTTTTYSDAGLAASTAYTYRVSAINSIGTGSPSSTATATTQGVTTTEYSISLARSGLVVSDSLVNETQTQQQLKANSKYWIFGGDAIIANDTLDYTRDTQGLHIGIKAPSNGTWAGLYAVSRSNDAMLSHAVLSTPLQTLPANGVYYEPGMYIQTNGSQNVNYVTCASSTSTYGTTWAIFSATGNAYGATNFTRLWFDSSANQPLKRECTLITNGNNYLKAYMDGKLVYNSTSLNLQMPKPFMVFLEPQSSYSGQLVNATWNDYYATAGENVTVNSLPSNTARVDIVNGSNVLATSAVSSGAATLAIGQYHFPLSGTIKLYDSSNNLITSSPENMYGGDLYTVTASTTSSTSSGGPISLTSVQSTSGTVSASPYQFSLANVNAGTGNNNLLVVGITANSNDVASVTFGGTPLAREVSSFNNNDAEFWYLKDPTGAGNVVVTMNGETSAVIGAYALSNVAQTNPIIASATNHNSSPSSPTISLTTTNPNDWVLDLPSIYGGKTLSSPSCSKQWDINVPSAITGASSSTTVASPASVTCSWTASGGGDFWDDVAVEINALAQ